MLDLLADFNWLCAAAAVSAAVGLRLARRRPSRAACDVARGICSVASAPRSGDVTGSLKRKVRDEEDSAYSVKKSSDDPDASVRACKRRRTPSDSNEREDATRPDREDRPAPSTDTGPPCPDLPLHLHPTQSAPKPQLAFCIPACKPSDAFTAFAGTNAAFTGVHDAPSRPAWCTATEGDGSVDPSTNASGVSSPAEQHVPAGSDAALEAAPLAAHACTASSYVASTGEEDEEVRAELRGVRLYVRRGTGDFTTGMLGHVKLLAHRTDARRRIVFRREPVWKVSMCVALRPAVRCSFDEDQCVLRLALAESPPAPGPPQVVLYALKRGRAARDAFTAFARAVVDGA